MNGSDDDIRWVTDHQPDVEFPGLEASSKARSDLMAHAAHAGRIASVVATPPAAVRPRHRLAVFSRPRRAIAMVGAAAVVATAALGATLAAGTHSGPSAIAPGVADAQTLVLLANHVAAAPRQGDATLVFHRNVVQGERPFTGADLYLDNGAYYYAETPAGLRAAGSSGPQDFTLKPIIDAMSTTANASPQAARAAFLKAADPGWGGDIQHAAAWRQDNVIWVSSIDVLGAAYGRPAVLAGTLRALSTVHGVRVTRATRNGVRTLEISMWVPRQVSSIAAQKAALESKLKAKGLTQPQRAVLQKLKAQTVKKVTTPAHAMRLTVNARTGRVLRYTDIGLVVTYHVARVNAAHYGIR